MKRFLSIMKSVRKETTKSNRVHRSTEKEDVKTDKEPKKLKIDLSEFKVKPKKTANSSKSQSQGTENTESNDKLMPKSVVSTSKTPKRKHLKIEYENSTPQTSSEKNKLIPDNWETVLQNLREMCKNFDEPVDSGDQSELSPEEVRYQALLSLMLSSRTKDQVTDAAMLRLREHGCTIDNILATTDEELGKLIIPVSFWKTKVKHIKQTTEILKNQYNGDIPRTAEDLCKLPGVGPKMAHLCMKTAWNEVTGIAVDTHVHRVSNRLGWVNTKTPDDTRRVLENWVPFKFWTEVDDLLALFGQQMCIAAKPQCVSCLNHDLCPYGRKNYKK